MDYYPNRSRVFLEERDFHEHVSLMFVSPNTIYSIYGLSGKCLWFENNSQGFLGVLHKEHLCSKKNVQQIIYAANIKQQNFCISVWALRHEHSSSFHNQKKFKILLSYLAFGKYCDFLLIHSEALNRQNWLILAYLEC